MVYGRYNYSIHGVYKPTFHHWGAPLCKTSSIGPSQSGASHPRLLKLVTFPQCIQQQQNLLVEVVATQDLHNAKGFHPMKFPCLSSIYDTYIYDTTHYVSSLIFILYNIYIILYIYIIIYVYYHIYIYKQ